MRKRKSGSDPISLPHAVDFLVEVAARHQHGRAALLELRGEHRALLAVFPQRLVDLARALALALEAVLLLGARLAVARLEKLDEAIELLRVEAQVEGLEHVLLQVEGDLDLDAAERDARVIAAPVGGLALPLERLAVGARELELDLVLLRAELDVLDVERRECGRSRQQDRSQEKRFHAVNRPPSMLRRSAMIARKASLKRARQESDRVSMSGTRSRIAQVGSTAVTVALRGRPSRRA